MADTKTQLTPSEGQTVAPRRGEYGPGRDLFGFNPFSMMRRFSEEMDRAFSGAFGHGRGFGEWGAWSPAIDVRERDGNVEISAELPGLTKDDVKVECTNEGIMIEGEKRSHMEKDERGFHRTERSYGHFCRMIPLPAGVEAEKARAEFKDGVLQVRIPLSEQARSKRRQIPISS
jgi:HSP20 family protein